MGKLEKSEDVEILSTLLERQRGRGIARKESPPKHKEGEKGRIASMRLEKQRVCAVPQGERGDGKSLSEYCRVVSREERGNMSCSCLVRRQSVGGDHQRDEKDLPLKRNIQYPRGVTPVNPKDHRRWRKKLERRYAYTNCERGGNGPHEKGGGGCKNRDSNRRKEERKRCVW